MSKEKKTFYYVEMSDELIDILISHLKTQARVRVGELSVIGNIIKDEYKERVGEEMPNDLKVLVDRNIAELMLFGWGRNYKEPIVCKNADAISDVLFDTSRILEKQRDYDEGKTEDLTLPDPWSRDIDLPRFKKRFVSFCQRTKQLRVFAK